MSKGLSNFGAKTRLLQSVHITFAECTSRGYATSLLESIKIYCLPTVESNPLTNKQRIACVTDIDNNLLLAGAGTGKTSVVVGKSGYLVNICQNYLAESNLQPVMQLNANEKANRTL